MHDRDLIRQIHLRPALFGLSGSYDQSVAFLLGLDLGCAGGLLRGFDEWLIVRHGRDTSLRWTGLVLEEAFPNAGIRRSGGLDEERDGRANDLLFSLLFEFLGIRESRVELARMYAAYSKLCESGDAGS